MTHISNNDVTSALEDYLETILDLVEEKDSARVVDIAGRLDVGKPAVTAALKTLAEKELVNYAPYKAVTLTAGGRKIAEGVRDRHQALKSFLVEILGMDMETAEIDACRMEHAIGTNLLERLSLFAEYVSDSSPSQKRWLEKFRQYGQGKLSERGCGNGR